MRLLLSIIVYMFVITANGQPVAKQQFIKLIYTPNNAYLEQATETIRAINGILPKTTVEYRAGRSVELLPGFRVGQGAVFTARIHDIAQSEGKLLLSAYPNPFDQSTTISFDLPEAGVVNLFLVNEKGQVVEHILQNSQQEAGKHAVEWQANAHAPGVYMPVLRTARQQVSSRIIKK